ncbi:MAG: M14-type cytosolic carboxypeptidase [Pseudomonadota bacterium]
MDSKQRVTINSQFDGGNIEVADLSDAEDIQLNVRTDRQSKDCQWFYFRIAGAGNLHSRIRILNAGQCNYPAGWEQYQAVCSDDLQNWYRVPTTYDGTELVLSLQPATDCCHIAYFAPYSLHRHYERISAACRSDRCRLESSTKTVLGRDLEILRIGEPGPNRRVCWMVARQHPGETMAEWWIEGVVDRLLDPNDAVARSLLSNMVFYVVPNMNPDGSFQGNLRTNAAGVNLNRVWDRPDIHTSPEVYWVKKTMEATGVDICFDVHGDEALPYNFIASSEGIADWNDSRQQLLDSFKSTLEAVNPDFQTRYGYPVAPRGKANLSFCTNCTAAEFGSLSMTHEMPFKDTKGTPDDIFGWSPARSKLLGASNLDVVHAHMNKL